MTAAELRILRFLPTHLSFREIAERTQVSANTVKTQANAVYRKFGVACRSDAVATRPQLRAAGRLRRADVRQRVNSSSRSARMIRAAASISARCENACGKLPRCRPVSASNSSA